MKQPLQRLQVLHHWHSSLHLSKRKQVSDQTIKVPQSNGVPGWLCLTRDETGSPISFLVPRRENPIPIQVSLVWDFRCFEDTILRVEYTPQVIYIADVFIWNSVNLFYRHNFQWRQDFLKKVIPLTYQNVPEFQSREVKFREDVQEIRGYEYYSDRSGDIGAFVDDLYEIKRTDIPDVYKVSAGGYLRVRTISLSRALRKLGDTFNLQCTPNEDGTWNPILSYNEYKWRNAVPEHIPKELNVEEAMALAVRC